MGHMTARPDAIIHHAATQHISDGLVARYLYFLP
jgi:hypothetical protein